MRHKIIAGIVGTVGTALLMGSGPDARACGGCFAVTQSGTVVTDHRMIFSISPQQTTLYDEIEYTGSPASFAWVLPIHGVVTVGLSADSLFSAFDQATQTTIVPPPRSPCQSCRCDFALAPSGGNASEADAGASVTVLAQQVVGPYETVQLKSTDPNALSAWLSANGYTIPANVAPVIAAYVNEGFDFLALRLVPGQGVQAMRPVSVTSPGAGLQLPLRMVAAGTGATVGVTLWVVAEGRYEPKSSSFLISPSDLTWDFNTQQSDYTTIRAQKETALHNAAWQIESSLAISPLQIENALTYQNVGAGGYAPIEASDSGAADGGPIAAEQAYQVEQQDLATLFPEGQQSIRVTRMRADLAQAALANDLTLQASTDQSTLSNIYQVTKAINVPVCPPYDPSTCSCGSQSSSGGGLNQPNGVPLGNPGSSGGGTHPGADTPSASESGCAVGPGSAGGSDVDMAIAGLVGLAFARGRKKKR